MAVVAADEDLFDPRAAVADLGVQHGALGQRARLDRVEGDHVGRHLGEPLGLDVAAAHRQQQRLEELVAHLVVDRPRRRVQQEVRQVAKEVDDVLVVLVAGNARDGHAGDLERSGGAALTEEIR